MPVHGLFHAHLLPWSRVRPHPKPWGMGTCCLWGQAALVWRPLGWPLSTVHVQLQGPVWLPEGPNLHQCQSGQRVPRGGPAVSFPVWVMSRASAAAPGPTAASRGTGQGGVGCRWGSIPALSTLNYDGQSGALRLTAIPENSFPSLSHSMPDTSEQGLTSLYNINNNNSIAVAYRVLTMCQTQC